jgi:hypothetical protein
MSNAVEKAMNALAKSVVELNDVVDTRASLLEYQERLWQKQLEREKYERQVTKAKQAKERAQAPAKVPERTGATKGTVETVTSILAGLKASERMMAEAEETRRKNLEANVKFEKLVAETRETLSAIKNSHARIAEFSDPKPIY